MKLLLFADKLPPLIGGMETHAHYFVKYFNDKYDLEIISKLNNKDCLVDKEYNFIKFIELKKYLENINDNVVIFFNSGRWIEDMTMIKNSLINPLIFYRTGGNEIIKAPLSTNLFNYEERKKYWTNTINYCVDYLITNSDFTDKRLIDIGINNNILTHIAGGVDEQQIISSFNKKEETRKKYKILPNEKVIVSCARFVPYKRPLFLIKALSKLNYKVIFAGDGPLLEDAKKLSKKMGLNALFLDSISQKDSLDLIAIANVYVQASTDLVVNVDGGTYIHTEGMGRSLLEAICLGVKVVVTSCGAVGEYIDDNNGKLVNNEQQFIDAINNIINNDSKVNNYEEYRKKYSFKRIFEEYEQLWINKKY